MLRGKTSQPACDTVSDSAECTVRTTDKSPTHDVDCVTGGAASDEFSPTASPGSPLDSDEPLDDLPPELLAESSVPLDKSCTSGLHNKDESSAVLAVADRTQAKDVSKVSHCLCVRVSFMSTGCMYHEYDR